MEDFGHAKHAWFKTFLTLAHGIPSHDTFNRLFAALDPNALLVSLNLPRLMNDSRKLIELHQAEYRRESQLLADGFADTMADQSKELKVTAEIHVQATRQVAEQINAQLADAEAVAKRIESLMESAASEWESIKTSTTAQCARLEKVTNHLDTRFAWRALLTALFWFSLAIVLGVLFGHYCWTH